MKHRSNQALFEYWCSKRGSRLAPERGEIEPGAIRHVLGDTFVLALDNAAGHPFRLAGTKVCALFGRELKAEGLVNLFERPARNSVSELISVVAEEKTCVVASVTGSAADDPLLTIKLELLLLPLAYRNMRDARLLGAIAPMTTPYWIGAKSIGPLTLGSFRHVGGAADHVPAPQVVAAHGRRIHGLTVYDGGRGD